MDVHGNPLGSPVVVQQAAPTTVVMSKEQAQAAGLVQRETKGIFGKSNRIQPIGGDLPRLLHKAEFDDTCCDKCVPAAAKKRQYLHIWDNKIEGNYPIGICGCLTPDDVCVKDNISVIYFDKQPVRAGMICLCIPATCCGPPVIYSKEDKFCYNQFSCAPFKGVPVYAAPCNCHGLKSYCGCCGEPCYLNYGYDLTGPLTVRPCHKFIC